MQQCYEKVCLNLLTVVIYCGLIGLTVRKRSPRAFGSSAPDHLLQLVFADEGAQLQDEFVRFRIQRHRSRVHGNRGGGRPPERAAGQHSGPISAKGKNGAPLLTYPAPTKDRLAFCSRRRLSRSSSDRFACGSRRRRALRSCTGSQRSWLMVPEMDQGFRAVGPEKRSAAPVDGPPAFFGTGRADNGITR